MTTATFEQRRAFASFSAWITLALAAPGVAAALPAFPGAEGYGSATPGGRGGAVFEVTSLADSGPGGITSLSIKAGTAGKSAVTVNGKGSALDLTFLPLADDPGVTVQLVSNEGLRWSQDYSAPARRSDSDRFQDKAD